MGSTHTKTSNKLIRTLVSIGKLPAFVEPAFLLPASRMLVLSLIAFHRTCTKTFWIVLLSQCKIRVTKRPGVLVFCHDIQIVLITDGLLTKRQVKPVFDYRSCILSETTSPSHIRLDCLRLPPLTEILMLPIVYLRSSLDIDGHQGRTLTHRTMRHIP